MAPKSTEDQNRIAALLGITVAADSRDVAAARIFDAVANSIGEDAAQPSTERQRFLASSLGHDVSRDSVRVASARIAEALHEKNLEAIARLDLKPGDHVVRTSRFEFNGAEHVLEDEFVISSIQPNGRIFFKGGNGRGAWPTQVRKKVDG